MKILLVNPPQPAVWYNNEFYPPSSLLYLAAMLKRNNEEVKILDMKTFPLPNSDSRQDFYENILVKTLSDFVPDLIGFGCLFSGNFPDILRFSVVCKERFAEIPTIAGGIHLTIYASDILTHCPSIDWIIVGEGEESVVQLVNTIKTKRFEFDKIDGFAYRKNGKVIVNRKYNYIKDLDSIPFPAYDLINIKDYYVDSSAWNNPKNLPINTSVPIITSRSCPNHRLCNFCSMHMAMGRRWRARSPENVVGEIEYVYNKFSHRHFSFMDDNLTANKTRIIEICNLIKKKGLNIQFEAPNGLNLRALDKEVIDALISAGLTRIHLAIESGSVFIRNEIMKKYISREKIYEIIRIVKSYKQLFICAFFLIGMPEETKETLEDTYNMIRDIDVDKTYIHHIVPYPGTDVFEQALRDNLLLNIDNQNLYKADYLYFYRNTRFFIKPYNLAVEDLIEFKDRCDRLIAEQKAKRQKQGSYHVDSV